MSETKTPPARTEQSKLTHHAWASPAQKKDAPAKREIGTVIGRATDIKVIKMPNGDTYSGLRGSFEATNAETGEVTTAGICYLPSGFHDGVLSKLEQEGVASVDFAYRVYSIPASNPQGFSYAMEPLLPATESDELSTLRALTTTPQKKLEAPKTKTT